MTLDLKGIHHLTAVSADIVSNKRFYTEVLGMRLVKRSVNQDDVSAYHLFYADNIATPGTDLTFFDFPVNPERRGSHSITRTALRVLGGSSLSYWATRLDEYKIPHGELSERDGRQYLDFDDPEGQRLSFVTDSGGGDEPVAWPASPVPAEHQIRGLGPITMTVPNLAPTDQVLQQVMNMRLVRDYPGEDYGTTNVHVYEMGSGGAHAELHVAVAPQTAPAQPGAGGVHHVAFRTPDSGEYDQWADRLRSFGVRSSGKVDRYYFRSLYFREPNGILFEIATDGPGFGVDEPLDSLGEKVVLPPFLEPQRREILAGLKPLD